MNKRIKLATKGIDITTKTGLELGPLSRPIVKKRDGVKIYYLDHLNTDDLKRKYADEPINPGDIVNVDFVMDKTIRRAVRGIKFDYVIAAHVIEHIPNTVAWLQDINSVLEPDGVLSLIVPDKRYTFDIFRSASIPSSVIGAYIDGVDRFTAEAVFDAAINYMKDIDAPSIWRDPDYYVKIPPKHRWTAREALELARRSANGEYIDSHCYVYTPVSFLKILKSLIELDLISFSVDSFSSTPKNDIEFYVILRKVPHYTVTQKQKEIRKLDRLIAKNTSQPPEDTRVTALTEQNELLTNELRMITNSMSWKVTKPLRKARSRVRS